MACGCNPNNNKCDSNCQSGEKTDKCHMWIWLMLFMVFIAISWLISWLFKILE